MKKTYSIFLAVFLLNVSKAQDTIPFLDPCFCYPRLMVDLENTTIPVDSIIKFPCDFESVTYINNRLEQFLNPKHNKIYGIAVASDDIIDNDFNLTAADGNCVTIDSINNVNSPFWKRMYYDFTPIAYGGDVVPCYIFLFNNYITTPDTFYVGNNAPSHEASWSFNTIVCLQFYSYFINCPQNGGPSRWGNLDGIFPILELPCPKPWKPRIVSNNNGRTEIEWQPGDTALYQLAFYTYMDDVLVFETDTLTDTTFTLTDSIALAAMTDGRYKVRLRKVCDYSASAFDTLVWSAWSEPQQFLYMNNPAGIEAMDVRGPLFSMSPNPAKGLVTVEISTPPSLPQGGKEFQKALLEIVDMEGRVVLTRPLDYSFSQEHTLDFSGLTPGVYLARLSTPQGSATRKLTIAR